MFQVSLGRRTVEALAFSTAGDALFAAAGRVLFRLAWPGGRVTHTSYHIPRSDRPYFDKSLAVAADGRPMAGWRLDVGRLLWESAADGRLMPSAPPVPFPVGAVAVAGSDPLVAVVTRSDHRPGSFTPTGPVFRAELVSDDGRGLGRLPFRPRVRAVWQEDERSLLVWDCDGLGRYRLRERPASPLQRVAGVVGLAVGPPTLAWRYERVGGKLPANYRTLARHPGGDRVFVGVGGDLVEWDIPAGREWRRWRLPLKHVHSLAVAPDGLTVAAGGWHGAVVGFDLD